MGACVDERERDGEGVAVGGLSLPVAEREAVAGRVGGEGVPVRVTVVVSVKVAVNVARWEGVRDAVGDREADSVRGVPVAVVTERVSVGLWLPDLEARVTDSVPSAVAETEAEAVAEAGEGDTLNVDGDWEAEAERVAVHVVRVGLSVRLRAVGVAVSVRTRETVRLAEAVGVRGEAVRLVVGVHAQLLVSVAVLVGVPDTGPLREAVRVRVYDAVRVGTSDGVKVTDCDRLAVREPRVAEAEALETDCEGDREARVEVGDGAVRERLRV